MAFYQAALQGSFQGGTVPNPTIFSSGNVMIGGGGNSTLLLTGTGSIDSSAGGAQISIGGGNAGVLALGNGGMAAGGGATPAGFRLQAPVQFNVAARETNSATAGANGAVPAQVSKYLTVTLSDGNLYKLPCFNP